MAERQGFHFVDICLTFEVRTKKKTLSVDGLVSIKLIQYLYEHFKAKAFYGLAFVLLRTNAIEGP